MGAAFKRNSSFLVTKGFSGSTFYDRRNGQGEDNSDYLALRSFHKNVKIKGKPKYRIDCCLFTKEGHKRNHGAQKGIDGWTVMELQTYSHTDQARELLPYVNQSIESLAKQADELEPVLTNFFEEELIQSKKSNITVSAKVARPGLSSLVLEGQDAQSVYNEGMRCLQMMDPLVKP